jgi:pyridoxal phosphate enzyme (YggS family)
VPGSQPDERRRAELVSALGAVRSRIAAACADSGRDPREVTMIAVTKTRPASDIRALVQLGVLDVGESKDQEARGKVAELAELADQVHWHLVGRLQTNKARSVVSYAAAVHSVDRAKLARALGQAAENARATPLDVFVQLSLDDDPDRGGAPVGELLPLAERVAEHPRLRLRGVMAVPPLGAPAGPAFARLAELSARLRTEHPQADAISAGMSDDFDEAIRHGSTHVRVGTALLGRRESDFG